MFQKIMKIEKKHHKNNNKDYKKKDYKKRILAKKSLKKQIKKNILEKHKMEMINMLKNILRNIL